MEQEKGEGSAHPVGEGNPVMAIDTPGGRFQVRFDETTPVSALGPRVFFAQFIEAGGRFETLCRQAPLRYSSNHAPEPREVLATLVLGKRLVRSLTAGRFVAVNYGPPAR
jgi:hypothetical protein